MLAFLYIFSIYLYQFLLKLLAPFHTKARLWTNGRKDIFSRLETALTGNTAPIAWFHCASLGEFEQGRPMIEAYQLAYPAHKIMLTFFSPSGYEVRRTYAGADYIFYLPIDTASNAQRWMELVKPRIAFFVKYEFWYHYLKALRAQGTLIVSFSAIFRANQLFFKSYGGFYRRLLRYFDHIFVQNQQSLELLKQIQIHAVTVTGDTRFDRVQQICNAKKSIPLAEQFKNGQKLLIIGSSWPQDMDVLVPFLNNFQEELKVIIAPHEIHDNELEKLTKSLHRKSIRYSQANESNVAEADVLLIDNIGMLSSLYQYAEFAYIGGAFGKGLHNILEAATFGMPVIFGPNYLKFAEAKELIAEGGAFSVKDTSAFGGIFTSLYSNEEEHRSVSEIARHYVSEHTGATIKIMAWVKQQL